MASVIPYPHRLGGPLSIGVTESGQVVGVDASTNILVAGVIGSGCSSVLRVLVTSAVERGLTVTVVDGTAPGVFREGSARHDYDAVGSPLLEIEDGTTHPAALMQDVVAGRRARPDLLVIDDAFDLAKVPAPDLLELYRALDAVGVRVAARVLAARLGTRDSYGSRILMGHATPMDRQLMLGNPDAPRVRHDDPVGTGILRYHDGLETRFQAYWVEPAAVPTDQAHAS